MDSKNENDNENNSNIFSHRKHKALVNQILKCSTVNKQLSEILNKLFNQGNKFVTKNDRKFMKDFFNEILSQ